MYTPSRHPAPTPAAEAEPKPTMGHLTTARHLGAPPEPTHGTPPHANRPRLFATRPWDTPTTDPRPGSPPEPTMGTPTTDTPAPALRRRRPMGHPTRTPRPRSCLRSDPCYTLRHGHPRPDSSPEATTGRPTDPPAPSLPPATIRRRHRDCAADTAHVEYRCRVRAPPQERAHATLRGCRCAVASRPWMTLELSERAAATAAATDVALRTTLPVGCEDLRNLRNLGVKVPVAPIDSASVRLDAILILRHCSHVPQRVRRM